MSDVERGVSTVVGVVLMVGIVVGLAAIVAMMVVGLGSDKTESTQAGPYFGTDISGEIVTDYGYCNAHEETIELTMNGGDPVPVENLELKIDTDDHSPATLDMPINQQSGVIPDSEIEGNDALIDQGPSCKLQGPILEKTDNEWTAGETISLRINYNQPTPDITPGDEVDIILIDTEQGTVVQEWTMTATEKAASGP